MQSEEAASVKIHEGRPTPVAGSHGWRLAMVCWALAAIVPPAQTQVAQPASPPLYLQADELIYDTRGNRVIARGQVELYCGDFILSADQVTYEETLRKLTAEGNAKLIGNGVFVRAERFVAPDEIRNAFEETLVSSHRQAPQK